MIKSGKLLSTLVLVAIVLAACGGGTTSTEEPGSPPPVMENPTDDLLGIPTESTAESGTGTEPPGVPVTGEVNPARLSNQLNFSIWNQDGQQIGKVDDAVIDLGEARVSYIVVGSGGFLGIGEKAVLVPWDSLELQTNGGSMTGGEQNAFILQSDQERFENAPAVDLNSILPEPGTPAGDWDRELRSYWESGVRPEASSPEGTAVPEMTTPLAPEGTTVPESPGMSEGTAGSDTGLQGVILASELLASGIALEVRGQSEIQGPSAVEATALPAGTEALGTPQGNQTGEQVDVAIDDAVADVQTGEIKYIVVNAVFEDGEHWIPIPLDFFLWDAGNGVFILNIDPAGLLDAPSFPNGQYPDMTVDGWDSDFDAYWQNLQPGATP